MKNAVATQQQSNVTVLSQSPDSFIVQAIQNNAPVETLEKLMLLKERYEAGEAKKAYIQAMQNFQTVKPDLKRTSEVKFSTSKGTTEYKFCSLSDIEKALKGPLSECGLTYRFENTNTDGTFGVRCIVTHVQGHSECTEMAAPADTSGNKNAIQAIGSTSTYLMRYTLIAAFALTTADEDDDGASNSELPLIRLISQSQALHNLDTLRAVVSLKEALAEEEYSSAAMYLHHLGQEVVSALWIAPTKGGIFTTEEIARIKSNECAAKRTEYAMAQEAAKAQ